MRGFRSTSCLRAARLWTGPYVERLVNSESPDSLPRQAWSSCRKLARLPGSTDRRRISKGGPSREDKRRCPSKTTLHRQLLTGAWASILTRDLNGANEKKQEQPTCSMVPAQMAHETILSWSNQCSIMATVVGLILATESVKQIEPKSESQEGGRPKLWKRRISLNGQSRPSLRASERIRESADCRW